MFHFHLSLACAEVSCAHLGGCTLCFLESWRCTGSGPVPTPSLGSVALGPNPVSCVGIAFPLCCHPEGLVLEALPGEVGDQGSATSPAQEELQLSFPTSPHPDKLVLF